MPERNPDYCANCGRPAVFATTNTGANVDYYCEICGPRTYPGESGLRRLEARVAAPRPQAPEFPTPPPGPPAEEGSGLVMRGGTEVEDSRLGRVVQFDEQSRSFPMAALLDEAPKEYKPRSYTWSCDAHFDQGPEGSCVGHAWAHEMVCRPVVIDDIDQTFARWVYKTAQKYDAWKGENYEGTSVLAGAKVLQQQPPQMPEGRGLMQEYRWIFGDMNELIKTLGYFGPVVFGLNWYAGMMKTNGDGFIRRTGSYMGGHCILGKGVSMAKKAVRLHQSWGTGWGEGGDCWISFSDLEKLLGEQGEICVPVHRKDWG